VLAAVALLVAPAVRGDVYAQFTPFGFARGQDVNPTFDGWERNPDGTYSMYFGYYNRNTEEEFDVPVLRRQRLRRRRPDCGQPTQLMGVDVGPDRYEEPRGFSLSLHLTSTADVERIFHELAKDGRVVVPLEKTFWAARCGMVVDRFGIPWLINCAGSEQCWRGDALITTGPESGPDRALMSPKASPRIRSDPGGRDGHKPVGANSDCRTRSDLRRCRPGH
jgi:hypothetical protein